MKVESREKVMLDHRRFGDIGAEAETFCSEKELARTIPGVAAVSLEGPSLVIETHDSPQVLRRLDEVAGLRGVQTRTPTLEDVYLHRIRSELAS